MLCSIWTVTCIKALSLLNCRLKADILRNVPKFKDIWIVILTNHGNITFAVIYQHPKTDFKNIKYSLSNILIDLEINIIMSTICCNRLHEFTETITMWEPNLRFFICCILSRFAYYF